MPTIETTSIECSGVKMWSDGKPVGVSGIAMIGRQAFIFRSQTTGEARFVLSRNGITIKLNESQLVFFKRITEEVIRVVEESDHSDTFFAEEIRPGVAVNDSDRVTIARDWRLAPDLIAMLNSKKFNCRIAV